jgi:hypothetical protein
LINETEIGEEDIENVKAQLGEGTHCLWVSAKTGERINELFEWVAAEVKKKPPSKPGRARVELDSVKTGDAAVAQPAPKGGCC